MKTCVMVLALTALAGVAQADVHTFPSAGSTVVGSVGFINPNEVGYFWTSTRGDSVTQTFTDSLGSVNHLALRMRVPTNSLTTTPLNWNVKLNGATVGSFTVSPGVTGSLSQDYDFSAISAASFTLRVEAVNVVPGGGGSHTFAANLDTTATLTPAPSAAALLGLAGLAAGRRRRA